jgi:hypothetical protein
VCKSYKDGSRGVGKEGKSTFCKGNGISNGLPTLDRKFSNPGTGISMESVKEIGNGIGQLAMQGSAHESP